MPRLYVVQRVERKALYLPMGGTVEKPGLLFWLPKADPGHVEDLIRAQLARQGITNESEVHAIIERAEKEYEMRIKVAQAKKEARRLMGIRAAGGKLMSVGFRKWKQVFHPAIVKGK